jgi:hypothetical protein
VALPDVVVGFQIAGLEVILLLDRDDDRVNRVRAFSGETENVGKFAAHGSRRRVHNDSPLPETESSNSAKWLVYWGYSAMLRRGEDVNQRALNFRTETIWLPKQDSNQEPSG